MKKGFPPTEIYALLKKVTTRYQWRSVEFRGRFIRRELLASSAAGRCLRRFLQHMRLKHLIYISGQPNRDRAAESRLRRGMKSKAQVSCDEAMPLSLDRLAFS